MPSLDIPPPDWKGLHQLGHQRLQILLLLRQLITPGKEQLWRVFWVAFFFFLSVICFKHEEMTLLQLPVSSVFLSRTHRLAIRKASLKCIRMLLWEGHSSHRPGTSYHKAKDTACSLPSEALGGVYASGWNCWYTFFEKLQEAFSVLEQAIPMWHKASKHGRRPAWLNREILV